nr:hypothetical protein [uncultured Schaedlerella sp.]
MKQGMWKKRLEYFWMYDKVPFLAVLTGAVIVLCFVYTKVTEKEYAFNAMLLDVHTNAREETLAEEYAEYAGINTKKYEVLISTSLLFSDASSGNYAMSSLARFYSLIGTEELDACMMLEEDFRKYAKADSFLDLRELFTEEELEDFPELYTDGTGRVLGIYGDTLPGIEEIEGYQDPDTRCLAGVIYNTRHPGNAKKFLEYLNEEF